MNSSMLEGSTASRYWYPTPLMRAPSSATSKAPSDTGVCCSGIPPLPPQCVGCTSVCCVGDPPTALSGGDSCHQFTEGHLLSSLLYCSHYLVCVGGGYAIQLLQSCAPCTTRAASPSPPLPPSPVCCCCCS